MINLTAIAAKFNVLEIAITRAEEWANCVFVVIKGIGARFVSKKVGLLPTEFNVNRIRFVGYETACTKKNIKAGLALIGNQIGGKWKSKQMEFELLNLNSEGGVVKVWSKDQTWTGKSYWTSRKTEFKFT